MSSSLRPALSTGFPVRLGLPGSVADPHDLVAGLPLPAVIVRADGAVEFANAPARRDIAESWLIESTALLISLAELGRPCPVTLTTPAGGTQPAVAFAATLGSRVVAVFEQERRAGGSAEVIALHRRILDLERSSATDRLTGLWNRRHFDRTVAREISFSEGQLSPLSLVIFDLDHFKRVNDEHGNAVGDDVLRLAAACLKGSCRPTDLLFRWGGEEFALLTPATSGPAAAVAAERLRARIETQEMPRAGRVTVSAGVGEHDSGESAAHWFERVDTALYEAKREGRNRVRLSRGGASALWHAQRANSALRLVWSDELASGHDLIDDQHRALFDASNALMATMTDTRVPLAELLEQLDCLLSAVARHFADEEAVLAEVGYPDLKAHRALHAKLLESARRLRGSVQPGGGSTGEIVEFLAYEIVNRHILKADRQFFPYVAKSAAV